MLLAVGCTKDDTADTKVVDGKTIIGAGISETRTSLGELENGARKVYWSNGDAIAVNGVASAALADIEAQSATAEFVFDGVLNLPYKAVYPASAYTDANTVTLAAVQAKAVNSFGEGAEPMAAYADAEGDLQFRHLCAVVKISLTADTDADLIEYVEFRGNGSEQVSGAFSIDYENATLASASIADVDKTVRVNVERTLSADGGTDVYIVVPAGTYGNGFTVKVVDTYGHYMEKSATSSKTLAAGEIMAMPAFAFVPTGTIAGIEIGSAAELAAFAEAYNNLEYADVDPLLVTLTADIVFDDATNASFEPIGGFQSDGTTTNYFNGRFNGNGKTIKNYASANPIFAYCGGDGIIYDLAMDGSCEITVDAAQTYVGSLVGYHKGQLRNCHSSATVTVGGFEAASSMAIGGLVGRLVEGTVEECSMDGALTVSDTFTSAFDTNVGGVVGYNSNANGTVRKSALNGNIDWQGNVTNEKRLCLGGMVGRIAGRVEECTTAADVKISVVGNSVYTNALGGMVGVVNENAVVADCVNGAAIATKLQRNSDASRYEYTGGIAGMNDGSVTGSSNSGAIDFRSAQKTAAIGGVVGYSRVNGSVAGCSNSGAVSARTSSEIPYGVRYLTIGGAIGNGASVNVSWLENTGNVTVTRLESNNSVTLACGGCLGQVGANLAGTPAAPITNKGNVTVTIGTTAFNWQAIGGVAGYVTASLSGVVNEGHVKVNPSVKMVNNYIGGVAGQVASTAAQTITDVRNSGTVEFAPTAIKLGHTDICLGGVLGLADATPITISGSSNTGKVERVAESEKINGAGSSVGGIAGRIINAKATIADCNNASSVREGNFSNSLTETGAPSGGGIVGFISGVDATNRAQIRNCNNSDAEGAGLYAKRGYLGGIAGYAKYVVVENCNNYASTDASIAFYTGGIVGWAVSTEVSNCVCKAAELGSTSTSTAPVPTIGGIAAYVDEASVISGSKAYASLVCSNKAAVYGGLAATSAAGASISDSGFGGDINGTAMTESDACSDANVALSGIYLWNGVE